MKPRDHTIVSHSVSNAKYYYGPHGVAATESFTSRREPSYSRPVSPISPDAGLDGFAGRVGPAPGAFYNPLGVRFQQAMHFDSRWLCTSFAWMLRPIHAELTPIRSCAPRFTSKKARNKGGRLLRHGRLALGLVCAGVVLPACGSLSYHAIDGATPAPTTTTVAWNDESAFHPLGQSWSGRIRTAGQPVRSTGIVRAVRRPTIANFEIRQSDLTLANVLARWAQESGATIRWSSSVSVPVTAASRLRGTVADAMRSVTQALADGGYPLVVAEAAGHRMWVIIDAPIVTPMDDETTIAPNPASTPKSSTTQVASRAVPPKGPAFGASNWTLRLADRDIRQALVRWGAASGNPVQWDSAIVAPITADSTLTGTFDTAITSVVRALQQAGYPLAVSGPDPVTRTYRVFQPASPTALAEVSS
ncbi:TcpQ domain-containing protein [Burkholderia stabilis]|uniref:TcpQ domain-containing protein n=1 Tax=Burkholderia stabilis TaxID=95485 RepID=UPI001F4B4E3B|nr:TcpQ domain-containing protein [Burkholderia stabilis]